MKQYRLLILLVALAFGASAQVDNGTYLGTRPQHVDMGLGLRATNCYNLPDGGFVIVGDNDRVLAHSDKGRLDPSDMPAALKNWLQKVDALPANMRQVNSSRKDLPAAVQPLLTSMWRQYVYFNDSLPEDPNLNPLLGGHPTVGCVALAMGQVMRYWGYPATGFGQTEYSYPNEECWNYDTLRCDHSRVHFAWDQMPDQLTDMSTDAQKSAVAQLMKYVGYALKMHYNIDCNGSSGAENTSQLIALTRVFGYNSDARMEYATNYSAEEWTLLMKSELAAGRPILFSAYAADESGQLVAGHAFVLDGYDTTGNFHVNWGWNGGGDGYFAINLMDPVAGYNFTACQTIVAGLDTNRGTSAQPFLTRHIAIETPQVDSTGRFQTRAWLSNNGDARYDGYLAMAVYDFLNDDESYHQLLGYYGVQPVSIDVDDTVEVLLADHVDLPVGSYYACLHFADHDLSLDSVMDPDTRFFDPFYDFEGKIAVTQPFCGVGIEPVANVASLSISPNPASDHISLSESVDADYEIISSNGRSVMRGHTTGTIRIADLPAGAYLLRIGTAAARFVKVSE